MSWKKAVAHEFAGWPGDKIDTAMAAVAEINDYAEKLGFVCHADDRMGFGNCFFVKGRLNVWNSPIGWVRATGTGKPTIYGARSLFHTPHQALNNERPFALIDQYGRRTES